MDYKKKYLKYKLKYLKTKKIIGGMEDGDSGMSPNDLKLEQLNLDNNFRVSNSLNSYTVTSVTDLKDFQLSGAFSCVPTKYKQDGRLLMWSLGCISLCKSLKCIPKVLGVPISYGLNISTPLYVDRSNTSNKKDNIPVVCEASIFLELCKLNIPIFFDLINMPSYNDKENPITGKGIIFGCRPYIINNLPVGKYWINKINCPVEGSI